MKDAMQATHKLSWYSRAKDILLILEIGTSNEFPESHELHTAGRRTGRVNVRVFYELLPAWTALPSPFD